MTLLSKMRVTRTQALQNNWDGVRVHHASQNSMRFKMYELFILGIFYLIFLKCC